MAKKNAPVPEVKPVKNHNYEYAAIPGPWHIDEVFKEADEFSGDQVLTAVLASNNCEIAYIETGCPKHVENAKLIAAAPDLLEAAVFCASVLKDQGLYDLSEKMAYKKAISAIEKALNLPANAEKQTT